MSVIKLNVIAGAIGGQPSRSFDLINQDIADANRALAPHGIDVDIDRLSVGGPTLHTPHTVENFTAERDALRSDEHLNVAYLNGPLYRAVSWRWRVRSAKIATRRGGASVTLFDEVDGRGNALDVSGDLTEVPTSHRGRVRSIRLSGPVTITVFSEPDFGGIARTFTNSVPDLGQRRDYFDWWRSSTGRATGDNTDWSAFDIWMQPGGTRNTLTWGIGQAFGLALSSAVTAQHAESIRRHISAHSGVRRAIRNG